MQVVHDVRMERDWARLARTIAGTRKLLDMTQADMADRAGVSRTAIQKMERPGTVYAKVQPLHRVVARILGWTEDSIEAILAGGSPTPAESAAGAPTQLAPPDADSDALPDGLSERARLALLGGKVVSDDVIDLAPDDPERTAVLVYKRGDRPATPEQMRDDLRKWAKLQRAAREIFSDSD